MELESNRSQKLPTQHEILIPCFCLGIKIWLVVVIGRPQILDLGKAFLFSIEITTDLITKYITNPENVWLCILMQNLSVI